LLTEKTPALDLCLQGPKNQVGFGRTTSLAWEREFDSTRPDRDIIKLRFRTVEDLQKGDLAGFLREHLAGVPSSFDEV
jgi:hypothetical protein